MKPLLWKEIRELTPGFALLLGSAVALGIVDVSYNWNEKRFVGMSLIFCWLISLVGALLGGANALARETNSNLAFLGSQPVSRRQVWVAKVAVTAVGLALLIALVFGICGGLLALRGYDVPRVLTDVLPVPLGIEVVMVAGLFACGVLLSTVIRSAMGAAGAALLAAGGLTLGYWLLVTYYFPARWGPWLGLTGGLDLSAQLQVTRGAWGSFTQHFIGLDAAWFWHLAAWSLMSGLAVLASAAGFCRPPVLEARRRAEVTVTLFLGLLALGGVMALAALACSGPRAPEALASVQVDPTGHWIAVETPGRINPYELPRGDLWAMDIEGQHLRRLSRGPIEGYLWSPTGERLALCFGEDGDRGPAWGWVADPRRGPVRRLPTADRGYSVLLGLPWFWSPRGSYYLYRTAQDSCALTDGRREILRVPYALECVLGWSPDEATLYVSYPASVGGPQFEGPARSYYAIAVPSGEQRLIAKLTFPATASGISRDGRWIIANRWTKDAKGHLQPSDLLLIDIGSGAVQALGNLGASLYGQAPGYLWCRAPASYTLRRKLAVVDTTVPAVVAEVGPEQLGGLLPSGATVSPRGDLVYFTASGARDTPQAGQRVAYVAHFDGTGLRSLGAPPDGLLAGWTHDDKLILWSGKEGRTIVRFDPATGRQDVVFALAAAGGRQTSGQTGAR